MDKTIEVVVVAMVVLVAATVVLFLFQDQTDSFGNFLGDQQSNAQCELSRTQYLNACNCNSENPEANAREIKAKSNCPWAAGGSGDFSDRATSCRSYCEN